MQNISPLEKHHDRIFHLGKCLGEIDLIGVLLALALQFYFFLSRVSENSGQVFGKDLGVEVLIDGEGRFAGPVLDLYAEFHHFVVFFDWPALMVEVFEVGIGVAFDVQ